MDRYILLIIFFLLIGARCLEKRSDTELELNHCDFWRNWIFTNDIALQFESDEFIYRGLTHICYFSNHTGLRNTLFSYDDGHIRNIFNGRSVTMCLIANSLFQTHYHFIFNIHRYIPYAQNNIWMKLLTKSSIFKIRMNWFSLAKYSSKPKYCLNIISCISKPKTSLLIILLLLMCGDTGASINPGPTNSGLAIECNHCNIEITHSSNVLTCSECSSRVHLECNNYNISSNFICNLCTCNLLPFQLCDEQPTLTHDHQAENNNIKSVFENESIYECFKNKGLHFIHLNVRSLKYKVFEISPSFQAILVSKYFY